MQLFGRQSDHLVFRLFASDVLGDGRPHSRRDAAPRVEGDGDAAAAGDDGLALQHGLVAAPQRLDVGAGRCGKS